MANCLNSNARPRNARQHITHNRTATPFKASSSSSIPLPTSCSALPSPLLFPDPEGSASSSLPRAASVSSASAQLPPRSLAFSALAPGSPYARPHLPRQPGTPEPAWTSEEIADQILSAAVHRHLPEAHSRLRLHLLHGHADLVPVLPRTPLRRPKQVRFCTGLSANLVVVICPIYLLSSTTKFDFSVFWPNYPQKCVIFLQNRSHNFCHFTHFSPKCTTIWGFLN